MESKFIVKKEISFENMKVSKGAVLKCIHQDRYHVYFSNDVDEISLAYNELDIYLEEIKSQYTMQDGISLLENIGKNVKEISDLIGEDKEKISDIIEAMLFTLK